MTGRHKTNLAAMAVGMLLAAGSVAAAFKGNAGVALLMFGGACTCAFAMGIASGIEWRSGNDNSAQTEQFAFVYTGRHVAASRAHRYRVRCGTRAGVGMAGRGGRR